MPYSDVDNSLETLTEMVIKQDAIINDLVQVLVHFHPYMTPAMEELVERDRARAKTICEKFPPSQILVPAQTIITKTH